MRKFLIAAALTVAVAGLSMAPRAEAMTLAPPTGTINQLNIIEQVALCFYVDGWNGPGMYQCGYRHRRGYGWHGQRDERRYDRVPARCPRGYTVQDGVCKPYRGY
jgi:hypothetical protein